jgi:hypothetical protein
MSLFGGFSGPELYYKYPNGDEVYNVTIMYLSKDFHGEVRINEEHTEWGWFAVKGIPENISPPIIPPIKQFKRTFALF